MTTVFLALGSNMGPREWTLRAALDSLSLVIRALRVSSFWETEPLIVADQPMFVNAVAVGRSDLGPHRLLDVLQAVEYRFGRRRDREVVKGPRTLDLDLLLYGTRVHRDARLQLPHPGIEERDFVLVPLVEVDPEARSPKTGRLYRDVLWQRQKSGVYRVPRKLYTASTL